MAGLFQVVDRQTCHYCGQTRLTYRRWLHFEMVSFLLKLEKLGPGIHHTRKIYPRAAKASTDGAYLTHWGLVKRHGKGEYELTSAGEQFVKSKLKVPIYVDLRKGKLRRKSSELRDLRWLLRDMGKDS